MRPRQLIEKVGPDTLRVVFVAFDDAWAEIAANYSDGQVEAARARLANMLLAVTTEGVTDAETLKRRALELMARNPS
jgi:leucyl-tRNA synthetase